MCYTYFCHIFNWVHALDELKVANPEGRFWIKLDATDVKQALMESGRKVWNGDVDMGDESLKKFRDDYEERMVVMEIMKSQDATLF